MIPTPWWSYLYRSLSMGELRNTLLRLKRDGSMDQIILMYIRWIVNLISQIWCAWCHAMASWQMCQHRADTFVPVFRIMNISGHAGFASTTGLLWLLVWVVVGLGGCWFGWCFSPFLTETYGWEQLRCSQVHTMCTRTWVFICAPVTQQQQCSFATTWWCLPAC